MRLYESEKIFAVTGPTLRPGGLVLTDRALAVCPLAAGARVLDIGCGQAATVTYLRAGYRLAATGIDPSAPLLERARRCDVSLPLVRGRAEQLPFADRSFAAVMFECSLSLMADPPACLAECRRVLEQSGYLIVSDLYLQGSEADKACGSGGAAGPGSCLAGAVSREGMVARLNSAGFELLGWEDHSLHLKELAARMIFQGVALRDFFAGECGCGSVVSRAGSAVPRPGYCLLWGRKRRGHG